MEIIRMWDKTPGMCNEEPFLEYCPAENKKTDATVVIFPGGGYGGRSQHEGIGGYSEMFNKMGMDAFVCEYRVRPHRFPLPLVDAQRAVRYVRAHAKEYGIDPHKVAAIGSSAGGHLVALLANYTAPTGFETDDEIDKESPIPDAIILCYPVIHKPDEMNIANMGSYNSLLGENYPDYDPYSPDLLVSDATPTAFIWHTSDDAVVNVINSYLYATALRQHGIKHEMHIFPSGSHGLGIAAGKPNVAQWVTLLENWLKDMAWL